jgi:hypothetical protein
MAEEIIGVKVEVDASDVGKSVGDLRKKIAEAEAQVKKRLKHKKRFHNFKQLPIKR